LNFKKNCHNKHEYISLQIQYSIHILTSNQLTMKDTEKIKMSENLKSIINNAVNELATGEMLALINLSAKTDLYLNNNKKIDAGNIEIEVKSMIKKYGQFIK